jgi:thiol:disulfide interchange protein DsbD
MIVLFTFIFLLFMDIITLPPAFHRFSQSNSFVTGFFAVLIASPCSGPFMGVAIGYALLQPLYLYYPIFTALALGYALPFTLADMFPRFVAKILPKSGRWMFYAKRILAIPVLMTVLWLIWIFVAQVSHDSTTEQSMWQDYNPTKIEQLRAQKKPILINFTAKWCLICLMNEKTTLSKTNFLHLAKQKDIQLFKADWTNKNPLISQGLEQYGRNSIPLYIYYDKNGNYTILPQILTLDILEEYFSE